MGDVQYDVLLDPYHFADHCDSALTPQEQAGWRSREKDHKGIRREKGLGRVPQSQEF